jgi:mRNA-degrading endonuclease toxin of MazEF toxin-antitoxin module
VGVNTSSPGLPLPPNSAKAAGAADFHPPQPCPAVNFKILSCRRKRKGLFYLVTGSDEGSFARTAGFAVSLTGAGTKTTGVVRCDQPRALDLGARAGKKLESVPDAVIDEVLAKLAPIFE